MARELMTAARRARPWAARAGVALILAGAVAIGVLHLLPLGISPIRRTISEYQLTDLAWMFNTAVLAVAAGTGLITAAMLGKMTGWRRGAGSVSAGLAVLGLVAVALFTKQDWSLPPTTAATVHRIGSLAAFICLPVAVLVGRPRRPRADELGDAGGGAGAARAPVRFRLAAVGAALGLALFTPILVAIITVPHGWWNAVPLGLTERGMALADFGALLLAAPRPAALSS